MTQAMSCIVQIEQRLEAFRRAGFDADNLRSGIAQWQRAITTPQPHPQPKGVKALSDDSRMLLQTLALVFDQQGALVRLDPAAEGRVLAAISEVERAIEELELSEAVRLHLLSLLARIRESLVRGDAAEYTAATSEFVGMTVIREATDDEERASAWRRVRAAATPIWAGAAGNMLANGAMLALEQAAANL
ncbi:hypothetical protein ATL40_1472 [Serinibacter salmoneus]|uniref:Uncharacterized protein n=2 Tax=Serinibacter salmoneus TaxID=556530 RepID=A0A2A9D0V7_9MICO|nr:hypothetical protein ATL40_1472 [Serinibacter salmoneus]